MTLVEPTFFRAARLWWSIAWRSLVLGVGGGVVAGVVLAFVGYFVGAGEETIAEWAQIAAFLIGTPACIYAAYSRIGKNCGDFRLVLVRIDETPAT